MKNAFVGYSYQEHVTSLMLAKMDIERNITEIEIEANVNHKFDDIKLITENIEYYFQIKDFDSISIKDLVISKDEISIAGKKHKLSSSINVIFFKSIDIIPDCKILDLEAYKMSNIYIISLSRVAIDDKINTLYKADHLRKYIIDQFFSERLDQRNLLIKKVELPVFNVFKTSLIEPTVNLTQKMLDGEKILFIEGKPGVGKSHLVVNLEKQYKNSIVYRFWISNQDNEYNERLQYHNFTRDFSTKLFGNLKPYTKAEIIAKLKKLKKTVIIDGLDHVENYNSKDLEAYISFIDNLKESCKVIVLSRPLQKELIWKKQLLGNWNQKQTEKVLNELYHIEDYADIEKIYKISNGYPILVRYIAEQFKLEGKVPDFESFDSIDKYYENLINGEKGKLALSLFLCVRSYIMKTEIELFLDPISSLFVSEFIKEHPYLFELKLNRISLFHDSFITYLRKINTNYKIISASVNRIVYSSIMKDEKRFLSRFAYFDLPIDEKKNIIKKYSSIANFRKLMNGVIDFEAIQDFYSQIREAITELSAEDFEVSEYYDLSLIINMISRDHISALNGFHYTYCKSLLHNEYTYDDFTSSRYLFGMLYYIETNDGSLILNTTSDNHYDTSRFYAELQNDALDEVNFFEKHKEALSVTKIKSLLKNKNRWEYQEIITHILENLYIHNVAREANKKLFLSIKYYMNGEDWKAQSILMNIISDFEIEDFKAAWILKDARKNILALGHYKKDNDYLNLSLKENILRHQALGSFDTWVYILNHIRLALHNRKKIDLDSISLFWTKYYQRKDYSFYSLDTALPVFEKLNYIQAYDSVSLVTKIQNISEKGYRGLLADYILQHPPDIIKTILDHFHPSNLTISWFLLPAEYINVLPDLVYNLEKTSILKYNRSSKNINYDEIENLLNSNRLEQFKNDLVFHRYSIWIKEKNKEIKRLKALKIPYQTYKDKEYVSSKSTGISQLERGILEKENIGMIKKLKLKSYEVASYSDENYMALADPDIFKVFTKEDIKTNIKTILYNAMTSRLRSIDHFHILWSFPSNMIKLL
ncbi:AAA family ATPase [Flavobacterium sp. LHD-80]|uniref:AAA family ATPase n=1 Tax=Flavobacterium sp. LHD-80 TaxID=3071411 RepID=UPI0027E012AF|nr:AAA family ATPase [Flavobacterium sp. LHD-80]MDQ6472757.1 AAA family ATPase [Flavobacterium sp. LHD-80]